MTGKELREALRSGKRVYGTDGLSVLHRAGLMSSASSILISCLFYTEHIAIDRHQLSWMCHGYAGKGLVPIVRIPAPDPYQACMAMDAGAKVLLLPILRLLRRFSN
ncbi:MAG: hypothetical protein U5L72_03160 [Bacteroidales bacterium]|nr:hypothetical protein [Bacteroidales bacterium]